MDQVACRVQYLLVASGPGQPHRLLPTLERGDDTSAPTIDILGNPQVDVTGIGTVGTSSDIGAFEFNELKPRYQTEGSIRIEGSVKFE